MKQVLAEKYGKQYPTSFKVDFEGQPYDGGDYCDYFITGDKE